MYKEERDETGPLSDYEEYLLKKLFTQVGEIPSEFWAAIRSKMEIDGPRILASELTGIKGEEWREVGATGQPAFQNSWVNFNASTDATAGFYKDAAGIVRLKGIIKDGTSVNTTAFVLPEGYRPLKPVRFAVVSNGAFGYIRIGDDGIVNPLTGSTTYFDLSPCQFRAA